MILLLATALAAAPPAPAASHPSPPPQPKIAQPGCPDLVTADGLVCRALEAQASGRNADAAQSFEEAAKASPDKDSETARLWAAAGNMWIAANQPGKAALDLDKALTLPSLLGDQRGQALMDRARAAEAQDDLRTARARLNEAGPLISDEDPFYWYFSAALAIREGDVTTAQSAIAKALSMAPGDPAVEFEAGHVAHFAGDDNRARNYWERSAAADPSGPVGKAAREALSMLPAPAKVVTQPKPAQPKS